MTTHKTPGAHPSSQSIEARRLVIEEGYTPYAACVAVGLHHNTLYAWHKKYIQSLNKSS